MKKSTAILSIITLLLFLGCLWFYASSDRTVPVIVVPQGNLTYTEGDSTSGLLTGVKATDDVDGDLSAKVRIYNIVKMENGKQAQVTYAVYDSSNNLGKATKVVAYETKKKNNSDKKDDTDDKDKTDVADADNKEPATTEAPKPEDDMPTGEGYDDPPLVSNGAPVMRLNTHKIEIPVGGHFYSMDYVETAVDDVDTLEYLYAHMYLEGDAYDVNTPGEYELEYYCLDSSGNISNTAKLLMVVGGGN